MKERKCYSTLSSQLETVTKDSCCEVCNEFSAEDISDLKSLDQPHSIVEYVNTDK